jgi:hypothetical protein
MLDAIWAAFQPYVLELFKHKIDVTGKKNDWKRSSIGKFMALYDSMIELEGASESIYNEFLDIALHDGAVTRTIIRSRLEELSDSSKKFVEAARGVNNLLSIYNDDLVIQIRGVTSGKGRAWHDLELWLDALPTNTDSKGRAIPTIELCNNNTDTPIGAFPRCTFGLSYSQSYCTRQGCRESKKIRYQESWKGALGFAR